VFRSKGLPVCIAGSSLVLLFLFGVEDKVLLFHFIRIRLYVIYLISPFCVYLDSPLNVSFFPIPLPYLDTMFSVGNLIEAHSHDGV